MSLRDELEKATAEAKKRLEEEAKRDPIKEKADEIFTDLVVYIKRAAIEGKSSVEGVLYRTKGYGSRWSCDEKYKSVDIFVEPINSNYADDYEYYSIGEGSGVDWYSSISPILKKRFKEENIYFDARYDYKHHKNTWYYYVFVKLSWA